MVLVTDPEVTDTDILWGGAGGAFLNAVVTASGMDPAAIYLASALPRHTPMADWPGLQGLGLGSLLAHHIRLAAPQRVLVLGLNVLPLLGHDPAQTNKISLTFNHEGTSIPLMGSHDLRALVGKPARKASFWHRWLDFSGARLDGVESA